MGPRLAVLFTLPIGDFAFVVGPAMVTDSQW